MHRRQCSLLAAFAALIALEVHQTGMTAETATFHDLDLGKDGAQASHSGGLGGAFLSPDEDTTHTRLHSIDEQRGLERILTDYRTERICRTVVHRHTPSRRQAARLHYMVDGPSLSPSCCGQVDRHWKVPHSAGVTSPTFGHVFE